MSNRHRITANQSGFTLVEIAIVLVIIGLLIGGILKGQELITNAKIKKVSAELTSVSTAYYAYLDRYKAIPGDDLLASTRLTGAVNGGGNGLITGLFNATTTPLVAGTESQNFWQHTRMAGLMSGDATATDALPPTNAVGGVLGIQSDVTAVGGSTFGLEGPVVCTSLIPWKIAQAVDAAMDDGVSDTGSIRVGADGVVATVAAAAAVYGPLVPATAVLEAGFHTLCMGIK